MSARNMIPVIVEVASEAELEPVAQQIKNIGGKVKKTNKLALAVFADIPANIETRIASIFGVENVSKDRTFGIFGEVY